MKKILILALVLLLSAMAFGAKLTQKQLQFVNEWGDPVNMGTSVSLYIYDVNTTTEKSCYLVKEGGTAVDQPITDDSARTPLSYSEGTMTFWCRTADYKITVTDGTYTRTLDNLTGSDTRMMWPTFLTAMSSYNLGESEDLDFTFGEWVVDGDTAGRLDFTPDSADGVLAFGASSGALQGDVYTYASATEFTYFDQSNAELNFTHIDAIVDDDSTLYFGDGKDISVKFDNSGDDLDITGTGSEIAIGADDEGLDVIWHTEVSTAYVFFDETSAEVNFADVDLSLDDQADLKFGDGDDFIIDSDTAATLDILTTLTDETPIVNLGADTKGVDLKVFAAATGDFIQWDSSVGDLIFEDANCMLMDDTWLIFGDGDDFLIRATSATQLDITTTLADETPAIDFGAYTSGIDVNLFPATTGDFVRWDSSTADLIVEDCNIHIMDAIAGTGTSALLFGDSDDIQIQFDGTNGDLDITGDGLELAIGATGAGLDIVLWGQTGNYVKLDEDVDDLIFEDVNVMLMDNTYLVFGDDDDFTVRATSASQLDIVSLLTDETAAIDFGADTAGIDVNLFAAATGNFIRWDSSASDLVVEDCNIQMMDDTNLLFGDGDDVALDFNSTEAALQVDGPMYGAKRQVEHILASHSLTVEESGKVFYVAKAGAGVAADIVITLPAAEAGIEYIIVDANETADADVTIQTEASDKIQDGSAGAKYIHDTDADNYALCYIVAIDAVDWVVVTSTGTWAAE